MPTPLPDSVDALRAQIAAGLAAKFLCFWGHDPKHPGRLERECLSQWDQCHSRSAATAIPRPSTS